MFYYLFLFQQNLFYIDPLHLTYKHIYVYKHTKMNLIRQLDLLIHCKYGHFFKILNDQKLKKKKWHSREFYSELNEKKIIEFG